jgi:hypothetical protein
VGRARTTTAHRVQELERRRAGKSATSATWTVPDCGRVQLTLRRARRRGAARACELSPSRRRPALEVRRRLRPVAQRRDLRRQVRARRARRERARVAHRGRGASPGARRRSSSSLRAASERRVDLVAADGEPLRELHLRATDEHGASVLDRAWHDKSSHVSPSFPFPFGRIHLEAEADAAAARRSISSTGPAWMSRNAIPARARGPAAELPPRGQRLSSRGPCRAGPRSARRCGLGPACWSRSPRWFVTGRVSRSARGRRGPRLRACRTRTAPSAPQSELSSPAARAETPNVLSSDTMATSEPYGAARGGGEAHRLHRAVRAARRRRGEGLFRDLDCAGESTAASARCRSRPRRR